MRGKMAGPKWHNQTKSRWPAIQQWLSVMALLSLAILGAANLTLMTARWTGASLHVPSRIAAMVHPKVTHTKSDSHSHPQHPKHPEHPHGHERQCGDTVDSAIANDCPFDVVSNLWTPRECYDSSLALEALKGVKVGTTGGGIGAPEFGLGDWEWYEDEDKTRRIHTVDELQNFLAKRSRQGLTLDAFTHQSFHAAHCSYLARVATQGLHRVLKGEKDVWVPDVAADPHHARHCEHVFGELFRLSESGESARNWTQVGFGIAPCVRIG